MTGRRVFASCIAIAMALPTLAAAQPDLDEGLCVYPLLEPRAPFESNRPLQMIGEEENEPNDSADKAQALPLGFDAEQNQDVDLEAAITAQEGNKPADVDFFSFEAKRGQVFGAAVLAIDADRLDSRLCLLNAAGEELLENDQHSGVADLYPYGSPFPAGGSRDDAAFTFAFPKDGKYLLRIKGTASSSGRYVAQFRLREPNLKRFPTGMKQIIFLDFDGETIDGKKLFGSRARRLAKLSPFRSFVERWGIKAETPEALDQKCDDLERAIAQDVRRRFEKLIEIAGTGQIEIRDNAGTSEEEFEKLNVSRVIIGGSIKELGFPTIGISQCVDPGNFSTEDTAVVLLDLLSGPKESEYSILSLPRQEGLTLEMAIARVVGSVATHEACHFLGCWHTDNANSTGCVIDKGGSLGNCAGVGPDGKLGSDDDHDVEFVGDFYTPHEHFGRPGDRHNVDARVVAALAVGESTWAAYNDSVERDQLAARYLKDKADVVAAVEGPARTRALLGLREESAGPAALVWTSGHPSGEPNAVERLGKALGWIRDDPVPLNAYPGHSEALEAYIQSAYGQKQDLILLQLPDREEPWRKLLDEMNRNPDRLEAFK